MAETTLSAASTTMRRWVMEEGVTFVKGQRQKKRDCSSRNGIAFVRNVPPMCGRYLGWATWHPACVAVNQHTYNTNCVQWSKVPIKWAMENRLNG